MTDLNAASQRLRDSVAALPDELCDPWATVGHLKTNVGVPIRDGGSSYQEVAECSDAYDDEGHTIAEHIATTSSPPTVLLVADLLAKAAAINEITYNYNYHRGVSDLVDAADALASAILHTETGERS